MKKNSFVWGEVLKSLTNELPKNEVEQWLKPLDIADMKNGLVILSAPNKFYKNWVEDKYISALKKVFKNEFGIKKDVGGKLSEPDVEIVITKSEAAKQQEKGEQHVAPQQSVQRGSSEPIDQYSLPLNKEFTFSNFVVGSSNRYAHSACVAAAKGFNNLYNPLYIYGDVGLGKTHLMIAVGNELRMNFPKLKILYTTGEAFMQEFLAVLRNRGQIDEFKDKYRSVDVLLFDDVQTIAKGEKTQEEFFFMFSMLHGTQKRIILTSNATPNEIPELDKRLSSRFSSGLMVDVQSPSSEEKMAIITRRFEHLSTNADQDTVKFLAENVKTDCTRDILGLVMRLCTLAQFHHEEVSVEFCRKELKEFLIKRDQVLSPEKIIDIVATFFMMKPVDLKSKKRSASIVYPRSIAMYLLREKTQLSLSEVGALFDRDHSTVMTAVKKMAKDEDSNVTLKGTLDELRRRMKLDMM